MFKFALANRFLVGVLEFSGLAFGFPMTDLFDSFNINFRMHP